MRLNTGVPHFLKPHAWFVLRTNLNESNECDDDTQSNHSGTKQLAAGGINFTGNQCRIHSHRVCGKMNPIFLGNPAFMAPAYVCVNKKIRQRLGKEMFPKILTLKESEARTPDPSSLSPGKPVKPNTRIHQNLATPLTSMTELRTSA